MKEPKIPTTLLINLITPERAAIILGKLLSAHPINNIPTKSNNLPKNPLVLLASIAPLCFAGPCKDAASISSSLSFLLIFSCLLLKKLLSFDMRVLLNKLDSFVFLTISAALFFA